LVKLVILLFLFFRLTLNENERCFILILILVIICGVASTYPLHLMNINNYLMPRGNIQKWLG